MPKGDVPGEWYSPTQPFPPSRRPSTGRASTTDDLIDFTPELQPRRWRWPAITSWGRFIPRRLEKTEGPFGVLNLPGYIGGTNWPGGSYDPETHTVYTFSQTNPADASAASFPIPSTSIGLTVRLWRALPKPAAAARTADERGRLT